MLVDKRLLSRVHDLPLGMVRKAQNLENLEPDWSLAGLEPTLQPLA